MATCSATHNRACARTPERPCRPPRALLRRSSAAVDQITCGSGNMGRGVGASAALRAAGEIICAAARGEPATVSTERWASASLMHEAGRSRSGEQAPAPRGREGNRMAGARCVTGARRLLRERRKGPGAARETIPDLFAPRAATGAALQPGARRGQRGGPRHLLQRRAHRLPSRRMTRSSWSASARCWILTSSADDVVQIAEVAARVSESKIKGTERVIESRCLTAPHRLAVLVTASPGRFATRAGGAETDRRARAKRYVPRMTPPVFRRLGPASQSCRSSARVPLDGGIAH